MNLKENLASELVNDSAEAERMGYPVGRLNGVKVMFQHYPTFEVAKADWERRAARVVLDKAFFLMTDRDGFSVDDLKGFEAIPSKKKILFSHRRIDSCANAIYVPGYESNECIGVAPDGGEAGSRTATGCAESIGRFEIETGRGVSAAGAMQPVPYYGMGFTLAEWAQQAYGQARRDLQRVVWRQRRCGTPLSRQAAIFAITCGGRAATAVLWLRPHAGQW
jgi:hypothetical protein